MTANPAGAATASPGRSAASGPTWTLEHTRNRHSPTGALFADACSSPTACAAVGSYENNAGATVALAEVWNGTAWTFQEPPNPAGVFSSVLSAVSCSSATSCTAIGSYLQRSGTTSTLAEVWNGAAWTIQTTPSPAGSPTSALTGISCRSATACIAVGSYQDTSGTTLTLAETWDGSAWSIQATPNPAGSSRSVLSGVSCLSAAACTAVGHYSDNQNHPVALAEKWDGTTWSIQTVPTPAGSQSFLTGVSCTSVACTAVGGSFTVSTGHVTLAERWNGTSWSVQATPNPANSKNNVLNGVSCLSATACTAVGSSNAVRKTLAEAWDGATWSIQPTPKTPGPVRNYPTTLNAVSCSSATDCKAVGSFGTFPGSNIGVTWAEAWDGTGWSIQTIPNPLGAGYNQLTGVSCSSTTDCTAVGSSGADNLVETWDGNAWSITPTPGASHTFLADVSCVSATACTAVGYGHSRSSFEPSQTLAEVWNGTAWSIQTTPNPAQASQIQLFGVSCNSATACMAVGSYRQAGNDVTLAESWNGTAWSIQTTPDPTHNRLLGVSCRSATECTAVGYSIVNLIDHTTLAESWDGTAWSIQATPTPAGAIASSLSGVSCSSATACTAVGHYFKSSGTSPLAEAWDGTAWSIQATANPGGDGSLNDISCSSATACTAVGDAIGRSGPPKTWAESWDGTTWTLQRTPNPAGANGSFLEAVSCRAAMTCTAVGSYANLRGILHTLGEGLHN